MDDNVVRIDELRLVVPGLARAEAGRLGELVANQLSQRLPARLTPSALGALEIRVNGANGTVEQLAARVVEAIVQRMGT